MTPDAGISRRPQEPQLWRFLLRPCSFRAHRLRDPTIGNVQYIAVLARSHQEVVGFESAMQIPPAMKILEAEKRPAHQHVNCLRGELVVAEGEQVLETRPEKLESHGVEVIVLPGPEGLGVPLEKGAYLGLRLEESRMNGDVLELQYQLLPGSDVPSCVK